jgi:hypothetical protein
LFTLVYICHNWVIPGPYTGPRGTGTPGRGNLQRAALPPDPNPYSTSRDRVTGAGEMSFGVGGMANKRITTIKRKLCYLATWRRPSDPASTRSAGPLSKFSAPVFKYAQPFAPRILEQSQLGKCRSVSPGGPKIIRPRPKAKSGFLTRPSSHNTRPVGKLARRISPSLPPLHFATLRTSAINALWLDRTLTSHRAFGPAHNVPRPLSPCLRAPLNQ